MFSLVRRYTRWLHTQWPAGKVEKLPEVNSDGSTRVPGLFVVGDLTGIPLLKFSLDTGARAVRQICEEPGFARGQEGVRDLVIVGAGVAGMAAAVEARRQGLDFEVLEASQPFSTIVNFPKGKPIYTYPTEMSPAGELTVSAEVKEALLEELEAQRAAFEIEPRKAMAERISRTGGQLEVQLKGEAPLRAQRVIVAIGRSGNYRKLGVPGEEKTDKVLNRLHDPKEYKGQRALVVGGGDSALEAAIALAEAGASVHLSYRRPEFSRPKPDNIERIEALTQAGSLTLLLPSEVKEIRDDEVTVSVEGTEQTLPNDVVFPLIGREPPLDFFRRSGVPIRGELQLADKLTMGAFLLFCVWLYHWKSGLSLPFGVALPSFTQVHFGPFWRWVEGLTASARDPSTLLGTLNISASGRSFYYSLAYALVVVVFGLRRIRRRRTPYVKVQTLCLMVVQVLPLFLLPELILPYLGHNGAFGTRSSAVVLSPEQRGAWLGELEVASEGGLSAADWKAHIVAKGAWPEALEGFAPTSLILNEPSVTLDDGDGGQVTYQTHRDRLLLEDPSQPTSWVADELFPRASYTKHGREYWRAYGFILAWPLFVSNAFTEQPMTLWLIIGVAQTFTLIPLLIYFFGKGAYCGWICSCGALAETLGDTHREKMPHGPFWSRLNMIGQGFLAFAGLLMVLRIVSWVAPGSVAGAAFHFLFEELPVFNYHWFVDVLWAGILGVGLYFWFSGRVWCRFACPLAALMHIYARFSRFRILADKKKCISCNVCTSVCHQGIDIMSFANKGRPMEDPECVRCSACVQSCPTGVLEFGQVDSQGEVIRRDSLAASPVLMRERGQFPV